MDFPIFFITIEQIQPEVFLFENVERTLYKNKWYLQEIIEHLKQLGYKVSFRLMNAKFYRVPRTESYCIWSKGRNPFSF